MRRRAEDEKPVIRVPVVVEVVRIQLTLVVVPVEVRDVAIAVGVREYRTNFCANNDPEHCLFISLRAKKFQD